MPHSMNIGDRDMNEPAKRNIIEQEEIDEVIDAGETFVTELGLLLDQAIEYEAGAVRSYSEFDAKLAHYKNLTSIIEDGRITGGELLEVIVPFIQ